MPIDNRTIHLGRAAVLALALVVPIIPMAAMPAYADNESAAAIEPPYQPISRATPQAASRPPVPDATGGLSASSQQDEYARDIYRPGVSDR